MNLFRSSKGAAPAASPNAATPPPARDATDGAHATLVFVKLALEQLSALRETRRLAAVRDALAKAQPTLERVSATAHGDELLLPRDDVLALFEPLRAACESQVAAVQTVGLDCIGKLFTYNFWGSVSTRLAVLEAAAPRGTVAIVVDGRPHEPDDDAALEDAEPVLGFPDNDVIVAVVGAVCGSVVAASSDDDPSELQADEKVQLMMTKALLAAVTPASAAGGIHGQALVRAVRSVFAVFRRSRSSNAQIIAQATLTQMAQAVFARCPSGRDALSGEPVSDASLFQQDAAALLRLLCRLGSRALGTVEGAADLKSAAVRTKLLALHLVNSLLTFHAPVLTQPAPFLTLGDPANAPCLLDPVRTPLCLLISRNIVSVVPPVMDVSMEICAKILLNFRHLLKAEVALVVSQLLLPMVEGRAGITFQQRLGALHFLERVASDGAGQPGDPRTGKDQKAPVEQRLEGAQFLVELYLNYDCDLEGGDRVNYWERLVGALAKILGTPTGAGGLLATSAAAPGASANLSLGASGAGARPASHALRQSGGLAAAAQTLHMSAQLGAASTAVAASSSAGATTAASAAGLGLAAVMPPAFTAANLGTLTRDQLREMVRENGDTTELRRIALQALVPGLLRSLVQWVNSRMVAAPGIASSPGGTDVAAEDATADDSSSLNAPVADDPQAFQSLKQRKQALQDGVVKFNWKPKRGIDYLVHAGVIPEKAPAAIAQFLFNTPGLDRNQLGEYLGEGDETHIAVMHAFVDQFDFSGLGFVAALRRFLQPFRLPGEAQKIDRFMLKFADRFCKQNPDVFGSADTAYVLSYSTIMLNTDQHNPQVKRRMTREDFVRNNRGIDGGQDLPRELLERVFDEISSREIKMSSGAPGTSQVASAALTGKTASAPNAETLSVPAALFSGRSTNTSALGLPGAASPNDNAPNERWVVANHFEHVAGLFQLVWMPILTALTTPFLESDDRETVCLCLDGLRHATHLAGVFGLSLERQAFVSTLARFTQLRHVGEMRAKHVEAIKALLFVGLAEGDVLQDSWADVLQCVTRLERLNALGGDGAAGIPATVVTRDQRPLRTLFLEQDAPETSSLVIARAVERLFAQSVRLGGPALVAFVRALCAASEEEVRQTPAGSAPRLYFLQKLVEISYYNMGRIRVEWSNMWAVLGAHFDAVGTLGDSPTVAVFALDKLRQLSIKFLEIEELPAFKFQREFLRPFEHIYAHTTAAPIKDMILVCVQQMVLARFANLRSGWRVLLGVVQQGASETAPALNGLAADIARSIVRTYTPQVYEHGAFPDLVAVLVAFCKNRACAKTSLQATELLRDALSRALELARREEEVAAPRSRRASDASMGESENPLASPVALHASRTLATAANEPHSPSERVLLSAYFGLHQIVMTCELEVRTRALRYLYDSLRTHSSRFSSELWDTVARSVLLPMFDDLRYTRLDSSQFSTKDDLAMWLQTTLVQALRSFVELFSAHFAQLERLTPSVLELLEHCMMQDSDAVSRIGAQSLVRLVGDCADALAPEHWDHVCALFARLVEATLPRQLLALDPSDAARRSFQLAVANCGLQLLALQTLQDLLLSDAGVLARLLPAQVDALTACFERSFRFAREFNSNMALRAGLLERGLMKQLPSLLKQETAAAAGLVALLARVVLDPQRPDLQADAEARLVPLAVELLATYNRLDLEKQHRALLAWRPVIIDVLQTLCDVDDAFFARHAARFYLECTNLVIQDSSADQRAVLCSVLVRAGLSFGIVRESDLLQRYAADVSAMASTSAGPPLSRVVPAGSSTVSALEVSESDRVAIVSGGVLALPEAIPELESLGGRVDGDPISVSESEHAAPVTVDSLALSSALPEQESIGDSGKVLVDVVESTEVPLASRLDSQESAHDTTESVDVNLPLAVEPEALPVQRADSENPLQRDHSVDLLPSASNEEVAVETADAVGNGLQAAATGVTESDLQDSAGEPSSSSPVISIPQANAAVSATLLTTRRSETSLLDLFPALNSADDATEQAALQQLHAELAAVQMPPLASDTFVALDGPSDGDTVPRDALMGNVVEQTAAVAIAQMPDEAIGRAVEDGGDISIL